MRSMIISLCFFLLSVTVVGVNAHFVTSYLEETVLLLQELPDEIDKTTNRTTLEQKVGDISKKWNSHFRFLSLSINVAELRDCTVALESFYAYTAADDPADYASSLSEALLRIKTLLYRERFSFINII